MIEELLVTAQQLQEAALQDINNASSTQELDQVRVKYTGKKGSLNKISSEMKNLSKEDKPKLGKSISEFHHHFNQAFEAQMQLLAEKELAQRLESESIDITLPGYHQLYGSSHILAQTLDQIEDFFISLGYRVFTGTEVETDLYNFEKMNLPKNHPARDMQDTFYINEEQLLRTHTSPVQARVMEQHDFEAHGPLMMISPGKVYRRDSDDATHSHQFQQVEGLVVASNITLADLKGTLLAFAKEMFGPEREIRLRPSYFPFTEPSVEVDVSCFKCEGKGCSVCKQTGWIEILGAGMVHPNVLQMAHIDAKKYSGFAFGVGIERVAMLKYNIEDIRHFYQNDIRFLQQFIGGAK